jgi:signal transduction histidine kinase
MSSAEISQESIFNELRLNTFNLLLLAIGGGLAVLFWAANLQERTSPAEIVMLWLAVEAVCVISYFVSRRYFRVAVYYLIVGVWLCNAYGCWRYHLPVFFYDFALISLTTSVLLGRFANLFVTVASTLFTLILAQQDVFFILMPWITLLTGAVVFRSLYSSLDMAWNYQAYAIKQMKEAREHRANLMQTTKTLNELRQNLERVNVQLAYARQTAEESRRLKAQFAANVSHELRTPINLIVGFSETIVVSPASYGAPLPSVYWADMNTIYRSARHLQNLINDVLDISQIEAGQMVVVKEEIDPRQVIQEAANMVRELIENRGLAFHIDFPKHLPRIYLDRLRIRQVLINLLSNAARFTDQGAITLRAELEKNDLRIDVIDTGTGILPKDLNQVFEEFHQLDHERARGGSGLGLTLSKQFVTLHGGKIWASSDGIPGKGSTFSFTLPVVDQIVTTTRSPEEPYPRVTEDGGRYFVVLDDDPAVLQLFERYCHKHRAVGVSKTAEALNLVERIRPAALIIDRNIDHDPIWQRLQETGNQTPLISCAMPNGQYAIAKRDGATTVLGGIISGEILRERLDEIAPLARHLLIISTQHDVVRMFTRMVSALPKPYHIWKAYSDAEGVELMRQQRLDVVIYDGDGQSFSSAIQQLPKSIPVILAPISGKTDELTAAEVGMILVERTIGFQPIELVRYIEALIENTRPTSEPVP